MTYLERARMIGNALVNGTATDAQLLRWSRSLVLMSDEQYDALTVEEKAKIVVDRSLARAVDDIRLLDLRELQAATVANPGFVENP